MAESKENKDQDEKLNRMLDLIKSDSIKTLRVDGEFSDRLTAEQLSKLSKTLKENTSVKQITFSGIKVNVDDFLNFLKSIKDQESIKVLNMINLTNDEGKDLFTDPNFLKGFQEAFATEGGFKEFSFGSNNMSEFFFKGKLKEFVEKLNQNNTSKFFMLDPNRPGVILIKEGFDSILKQIKAKDPRAQIVDLSGRTLNASQIQELSQALEKNDQVLSLNLEGAIVEMDAFPSLLKVLSNHPSIQELNLNGLGFKPEPADFKLNLDSLLGGSRTEVKGSKEEVIQKAFQDMIRQNGVLRKLLINNVDPKFWKGKGFELFMDALNEHQPVKEGGEKQPKKGLQIFHLELDLSSAKKEGLEKLAKFLKLTQTLEVLNIMDLRMGLDSEILTRAMSENDHSKLRVLNMRGYKLTDAAIQHIAAILKKQALRELKLYSCEIGSSSAKILARGLAENRSLEELDLTFNHITNNYIAGVGFIYEDENGTKAICDALAGNSHSKLETLKLSNNYLKYDMIPVVRLLKTNQVLRHLSLDGNALGDNEFKLIAEGLTQNKGLFSLNLNGHSAGSVGLLALEQALDTNTTLNDLQFNPTGGERGTDADFRFAAVRIGGKLAENQYQMRFGAVRSSTTSDERQTMTTDFDQTKNKPTMPVSGKPTPPKPESKKPE